METANSINYQHLFYFLTVVRKGSITAAARALYRSQPTVSIQLAALEQSLGEPLFRRTGKRIILTEAGRIVAEYAESIFRKGAELKAVLSGKPTGRTERISVGVSGSFPKHLVARLFQPLLVGPNSVRIEAREGRPVILFADLMRHDLDVVFTDSPLPLDLGFRAYSRPIGRSEIVFMARPSIATRIRRRFPKALDGAPFVMPGPSSSMHRSLETWFADRRVNPKVIAECDEAGLMKTIGAICSGVFPIPAVIERMIAQEFGVRRVGKADGVTVVYHAINMERTVQSPALATLLEEARRAIF